MISAELINVPVRDSLNTILQGTEYVGPTLSVPIMVFESHERSVIHCN